MREKKRAASRITCHASRITRHSSLVTFPPPREVRAWCVKISRRRARTENFPAVLQGVTRKWRLAPALLKRFHNPELTAREIALEFVACSPDK
jgi:hypothetical protein